MPVNPSRACAAGVRADARTSGELQRMATRERLPACAQVTLKAGDRLALSLSTGGGGYGPPSERDASQVACDVAEGWITRARAQGCPA